MNDILQDLTATNLTTAIENNLFASMLTLGKWPQLEIHDEATLMWSISDIPFPLFNAQGINGCLPSKSGF